MPASPQPQVLGAGSPDNGAAGEPDASPAAPVPAAAPASTGTEGASTGSQEQAAGSPDADMDPGLLLLFQQVSKDMGGHLHLQLQVGALLLPAAAYHCAGAEWCWSGDATQKQALLIVALVASTGGAPTCSEVSPEKRRSSLYLRCQLAPCAQESTGEQAGAAGGGAGDAAAAMAVAGRFVFSDEEGEEEGAA
jgi:hypothetical protein